MIRFRHTILVLLVLGIVAIIVAGSYPTSLGNNPSSNVPTFAAGLIMILLAIVLFVVSKREERDGT